MNKILKQLEKTKKALAPSDLEVLVQNTMDDLQSVIDYGKEFTFKELVNVDGLEHNLISIETVANFLRENVFNTSTLVDNSSVICDEDNVFRLCVTVNGSTYKMPLYEEDVEEFSDNFTIVLVSIIRAVGVLTVQVNKAVELVKDSSVIKMTSEGADSDERAYNTLLSMINNKDTDGFTKYFVSKLINNWETTQSNFLTVSKKELIHLSPFYALLSNGLKVDKIDKGLPIRMLELLSTLRSEISEDDFAQLIIKVSQIGILIENPVLNGKMHKIDELTFSDNYTSLFRSIYEEESLGVNSLNKEEKEMLNRIIILDNIMPKIRETIISLGGVAEDFDDLDDLDDELCDCNLCQEDKTKIDEEINEIIGRLVNHENKSNVPKEVVDAVSVLASFFN